MAPIFGPGAISTTQSPTDQSSQRPPVDRARTHPNTLFLTAPTSSLGATSTTQSPTVQASQRPPVDVSIERPAAPHHSNRKLNELQNFIAHIPAEQGYLEFESLQNATIDSDPIEPFTLSSLQLGAIYLINNSQYVIESTVAFTR